MFSLTSERLVSSELRSYVATGNDIEGGTPLALSRTFWVLLTILALSSVLMLWRGSSLQSRAGEWLETDTGAHLCKEMCSDVSNAIVEGGGQGSFRAAKVWSMVNGFHMDSEMGVWSVSIQI